MAYMKDGYANGQPMTMKAPYKIAIGFNQLSDKDAVVKYIKDFGANSFEVESALIS